MVYRIERTIRSRIPSRAPGDELTHVQIQKNPNEIRFSVHRRARTIGRRGRRNPGFDAGMAAGGLRSKFLQYQLSEQTHSEARSNAGTLAAGLPASRGRSRTKQDSTQNERGTTPFPSNHHHTSPTPWPASSSPETPSPQAPALRQPCTSAQASPSPPPPSPRRTGKVKRARTSERTRPVCWGSWKMGRVRNGGSRERGGG